MPVRAPEARFRPARWIRPVSMARMMTARQRLSASGRRAKSRRRGIQCYGIGPAIDIEDGLKGFGAHSDQDRILERELLRFLRFHYDIVVDIAGVE
jgi:hypothetical protein